MQQPPFKGSDPVQVWFTAMQQQRQEEFVFFLIEVHSSYFKWYSRGQKCCSLFHTQNEEKLKKIAPVYAYTHSYARKRDGGGKSAPPESNRVKKWKVC